MVSNIIEVLPQKLLRTIEYVELDVRRLLNDKVCRKRRTHTMDSGYQQADRPQVRIAVVPPCSAPMARRWRWLSARWLLLCFDDPRLSPLKVEVKDDGHCFHALRMLREHSPE